MFKKVNKGFYALVVALFIVVPFTSNAQDGKALFDVNCATCHTPHRDLTGPALYKVRDLWKEAGAPEEAVYQWVNNWAVALEKYEYAKEVEGWSPSAMTFFPDLTKEQITAIFDYIDSTPLPGAEKAAGGGGATASTGSGTTTNADEGLNPMWYVFGSIFLILIFAMGGIKRKLEETHEGPKEESQIIGTKKWAWKNKKMLLISGFVVVVGLTAWLFIALNEIGVVSGYHPSQPIDFPHNVHAGINKIDCKYCHNSADNSRTAGLPTTNVCMNCHKLVQGSSPEAKEEISKIYYSAGFSPDGGGTYSGETHPIVWNKVHTLPDFVYFSHEQHVVVGGVDCKQCHGDMTKRNETAKVVPVEELNKIEGNVQLTKPTFTMGWCVECHTQKEVSGGPLTEKGNGYYDEIHRRLIEFDPELYERHLEDHNVTVSEMGGLECAKCHY